MTMMTLTTAQRSLMWPGRADHGAALAMACSLLIFAGIVPACRAGIADLYEKSEKPMPGGAFTSSDVMLLALMIRGGVIVYVERSERRIPVQYPNVCWTESNGRTIDGIFRCGQCGRRDAGHLRLLDPGVAADAGHAIQKHKVIGPILDAMPAGGDRCMRRLCGRNHFFATSIFSIVFNPNEVADICGSGRIHSWDPAGKRTADYINDVLTGLRWWARSTCD